MRKCDDFLVVKTAICGEEEKGKNKGYKSNHHSSIDTNAIWRTVSLCFAPIFMSVIYDMYFTIYAMNKMKHTAFSSNVSDNLLPIYDGFGPKITLIRAENSDHNFDNGWRMTNGNWVMFPTAYDEFNKTLHNSTINHHLFRRQKFYLCFTGWIDEARWTKFFGQIYGDVDFLKVSRISR